MTPASPRKRRTWPRRVALISLALFAALAAQVVVWWSPPEEGLSAEERQLVGFWTPDDSYYQPWGGPARKVVIEYRADRTVRTHVLDTQTGMRSITEGEVRWRAYRGRLFYDPRDSVGERYQRGDFKSYSDVSWRLTWDGPDQFHSDRIDPPPGAVALSFTSTRCPAPEYP
jgi:hypothetical protein